MRTLLALLILGLGVGYLQYNNVNLHNTTVYYTCPPYFFNNYTQRWNMLEKDIVNTNAKNIVIYWNGGGGTDVGGNKLINAVQTAQLQGKYLHFIVQTDAISMHAVTACYADIVTVQPGGNLIYHAAFYGNVDGSKNYNLLPWHRIEQDNYFRQCERKHILDDYDINLIEKQHVRIIIDSEGHKTIASDWKTWQ